VKPIYSSGRCRRDVLYIQIPNLICRGVLRSTLITLCFILADDLRINILKFVAGHGAVVQPASINIVFGYKQAQQYSRIHQLDYIRAVSWSAQNTESRWSHVHSYTRTLQLSCISCEVWVTVRFDVLFKSLNVTQTTSIFLAHFRFLKKIQIFLMLLGIMHAASPLPKSPLISSYQQQKHLA